MLKIGGRTDDGSRTHEPPVDASLVEAARRIMASETPMKSQQVRGWILGSIASLGFHGLIIAVACIVPGSVIIRDLRFDEVGPIRMTLEDLGDSAAGMENPVWSPPTQSPEPPMIGPNAQDSSARGVVDLFPVRLAQDVLIDADPRKVAGPGIMPEGTGIAPVGGIGSQDGSGIVKGVRNRASGSGSVAAEVAPDVGSHGGGHEPRIFTFGGLPGQGATEIVYVVDASGSMIGYLPFVISDLKQSIEALAPDQRFRVIFFQRNDALIVPGPGEVEGGTELLVATEANRRFVIDWIDLDTGHVHAAGRSNPLEAISIALTKMTPSPDLLYVLSTDITGVGEFEIAQDEILRTIDVLNRRADGSRKSVIKTIQFVDEDPLQTLRKIAQRNGGVEGYQFVDRQAMDTVLRGEEE